ncbi:MAG: hypothetical protein IJ608_04505 [Lachnospiraceae bacterium]|nr:hypothetical protein [Lachnospiraceae bacterium]
MELKDMKDLIDIYDAAREIDGAMGYLVGMGQHTGGAVGKLNRVYDIILRNTTAFNNKSNVQEINNVLFNLNVSAEERAKALLGVKKEEKKENNMSFELWLFAVKHLGQNFETTNRIYAQLSYGEKEILKKEYEETT